MIKKLNIVLAVVFVLLFGLKGLKEIKVARERNAAAAPALVMKFYKAARRNSPKGPGGHKNPKIIAPNGPIY